MNGAALETERLVLRQPGEDEFEDWARCFADPDVNRYLSGEPMSRAHAWRHLASVVGHWALRGYGFFSVFEKDGGAWVGRVGPWFPEGWPEPEVGWAVAPWAQRKGYAAEAATATLDWAFDTLGWERVVHVILAGNEASARTAEKLGSRRLYDIADIMGLGPAGAWGQTREEWRADRSSA